MVTDAVELQFMQPAVPSTVLKLKKDGDVAQDVEWAIALLKDRTAERDDEDWNRMPKHVINSAEGFAFITMTRVGFGISHARGHGFVVKKLQHNKYGSNKWGQPFFFTVRQTGIGAALGVEKVKSCLALVNQFTMNKFKQGHLTFGADIVVFSTHNAILGSSAGVVGTSRQLSIEADNANVCFSYATAKGAFFAISFNGGSVSPDHSRNEHLYGKGVSADAIMDGQVPVLLEDMEPLLNLLNDMSAQAAMESG